MLDVTKASEIRLSPADPSLAEWLYEERKDPDTVRFNPLAPSDVEGLRDRLLRSSSNLADFSMADAFFWMIKMDEKILGHVSIQNINRSMLTAEIGYGVSRPARGRGIATAALQMFVRKIFSGTPLRKLTALVHDQNLASIKALNKVGFYQEGLLREHYLVNGEPVNEIIFGLLRSDLK